MNRAIYIGTYTLLRRESCIDELVLQLTRKLCGAWFDSRSSVLKGINQPPNT